MSKSLSELSQDYGVSVSTLKKYRGLGINVEDKSAVLSHYEKNRGHTKSYLKKEQPKMAPVDTTELTNQSTGLNATLDRLRKLDPFLHDIYLKSLADGEPLDVQERKKKSWLDVAEKVRQVETTNPEVSEKTKNLVNAADVSRDLYATFNAFVLNSENLGARTATQFGNPEIKAFINQEVKKIINALYQCPWLEDGDGEVKRAS